jgi:hypothetical protein
MKEDEKDNVSQIEALVNKLEEEANPEVEIIDQDLLDEDEAAEYDDAHIQDNE